MKAEAVQFIRNLKENPKIISHNDADGICSLAILLHYLNKKGINAEYELTEVPIKHVEKGETMVFLDISLDNALKFASEKTLVIDHHLFDKRPDLPFYNPRETDEKSYIPASYLIYEVCSELEDMEEVKWIACAGIIGDKGDKNSDVCKKFVDSLDDYKNLSLVSDHIFSADLVDNIEGDNRALEIIRNAKSAKELLHDPYLNECYEEVQKELSNYKNKMEQEDKIIFVEVESRYNIKSIIASRLLEKNKNIIVVAYSTYNDAYNISLRTNTDVNLGAISKKVAELCGGDGGGHEKAAGAKVSKSKFPVFREEFVSEVEKCA